MAKEEKKKLQISLVLGDITTLEVDCIVNSANKSLLAGSGVCGIIHRKAGRNLELKCKQIGRCEVGKVVVTDGYNLPARLVIHTVGPIYGLENGKESDLLYQCYFASLNLAEKHLISSIAFPSISTGIHGYPVENASLIAAKAFADFAKTDFKYLKKIIMVAYSDSDYQNYFQAFKQLQNH